MVQRLPQHLQVPFSCGKRTPSHPTGSHAPAPALAPPGALRMRQVTRFIVPRAMNLPHPPPRFQVPGSGLHTTCKSLNFAGSRAHATTSTPPGARPKRPMNRHPPPTGSRAPAPNAEYACDRPQRRGHTLSHTTDSPVPVPTSAPPSARRTRLLHTYPHSTGIHTPTTIATPAGARQLRRVRHSPAPGSQRS